MSRHRHRGEKSRLSEDSPPRSASPQGPGRPLLGTPSLSSRCRRGRPTLSAQAGETRLEQQGPATLGHTPQPRSVPGHPAATRSPEPGARNPEPARRGPSLTDILPLTGCRSRSHPAPPSGPKLLARVSLSDLISGLGRRGGAATLREGRAIREDTRPPCTSALRCAHFRFAVGGPPEN